VITAILLLARLYWPESSMLLMNLRKPGPYQYSAGSPWKLPGVGDDVLDGGARADVVAVQDGVDAVAIDQALHGLHVGGVAHLLGVFEVRLERAAEHAAERVDLLASQRQAVLEFNAVGSSEIGERRGLPDRDGLALRPGFVVGGLQQGGRAGERAGADQTALDEEIAAGGADDDRRGRL
jgi:hypothetical protein